MGGFRRRYAAQAGFVQAGLFKIQPLLLPAFAYLFGTNKQRAASGAISRSARVATAGGDARGTRAAARLEHCCRAGCGRSRSLAHAESGRVQAGHAVSASVCYRTSEADVAFGLDFSSCTATGFESRGGTPRRVGASFGGGTAAGCQRCFRGTRPERSGGGCDRAAAERARFVAREPQPVRGWPGKRVVGRVAGGAAASVGAGCGQRRSRINEFTGGSRRFRRPATAFGSWRRPGRQRSSRVIGGWRITSRATAPVDTRRRPWWCGTLVFPLGWRAAGRAASAFGSGNGKWWRRARRRIACQRRIAHRTSPSIRTRDGSRRGRANWGTGWWRFFGRATASFDAGNGTGRRRPTRIACGWRVAGASSSVTARRARGRRRNWRKRARPGSDGRRIAGRTAPTVIPRRRKWRPGPGWKWTRPRFVSGSIASGAATARGTGCRQWQRRTWHRFGGWR
jgi:hypothetical protein